MGSRVGEGQDLESASSVRGEVSEREAALAELALGARGHAGRARAASTERGYAEDWTRFRLWCVDMNLDALPADPLTVALYLTHLAPAWRPATTDDPPDAVVAGEVLERRGLAPGSIARALASISVRHRAAGYPSPARDPRVLDVLSGIRRHHAVAPPRRVEPALTAEVQAMVAGLPGDTDPTAARDAALILVGYTAALRRSELAALSLADITEQPDGTWIEVFLASSKTDQHRQGHTVRIPATGGPACPVLAWTRWRTWLTAAPSTDEPAAPGRRSAVCSGDGPGAARCWASRSWRSAPRGRAEVAEIQGCHREHRQLTEYLFQRFLWPLTRQVPVRFGARRGARPRTGYSTASTGCARPGGRPSMILVLFRVAGRRPSLRLSSAGSDGRCFDLSAEHFGYLCTRLRNRTPG